MKNVIVFFASTPISHINPLKPLINFLNSYYNANVVCFSDKKNKSMIEKMGASFQEYPKGIYVDEKDKNLDYLKEASILWKNGKIEEGFNFFTEQDIRLMYNISNNQIEHMIHIIRKLNPKLIFRDSADRLGYYVSKKMDIPTIGYITNNLYSKLYFESNPSYLYSLFLNFNLLKKPEFRDYFENYREVVKRYNIIQAQKNNIEELNPFHQFDPMTEFSIIFSTNFLQPNQSFYNNRIYQTIYPSKDMLEVESNIDCMIKEFVEKSESLIYLSTGSIICNPLYYYIAYIESFKNTSFNLLIACKDYFDEINQYILDNDITNVLIVKYAPQKYILSKAKLFITSGGQNSLIESIYYKTPMIVNPITSEQRLNGIEIERLGIGVSTQNFKRDKITFYECIQKIMNDDVKALLSKYSEDIKEHNNNFTKLYEFINPYMGEIK